MRASYYSKDKRKYGDMSYESKYLLNPKYMTKRDLRYYYRYYHSMNKGQRQCKKIIFIVLCVCLIAYIFVDYNLRTKIIQLRDRFEVVPRVDADYNATEAYFVDTVGCRMPYFEASNYRILQYMGSATAIVCNKALTRTSEIGNTLWWTMTDSEIREHYNISDSMNIICFYNALQRETDFHNKLSPNSMEFRLQYNHSLEIPAEMEFIRVWCETINGNIFYEDYHFFALNKSVDAAHTANTTTMQSLSHSKGRREPMKVSMHSKDSKVPANQQQLPLTRPAAPIAGILSTSESSSAPSSATSPKLSSSHSTSSESTSSSSTSTSSSSSSTSKSNAHSQRLSVMVLGIDSVSHLNFLRNMKQTANYIHNYLEHVELWGFNKVADNTYPNLMPVLSGLSDEELELSCLNGGTKNHYDNCPLLWKRFKEAGYMTAYLEDVGTLSLFNFYHEGFVNPPTDYYLRPIALEMERKISYNRSPNVHLCVGGRRTVDLVFEMLRKLMPYLKTQDFFSFCWTVSFTHDIIYMPKLLDNDFVQLFELFASSGIFNKTMLFLMSDHGMRWGSFRKTYQGMMEERQPLFIAIFPKWFEQQHPLAVANMRQNAHRLTSFYDVHATALDLLNLSSLKPDKLQQRTIDLHEADVMPRGISLFLPVPKTRTCELAGIASHWCTCHQRQDIPTNDARVQDAARYVVKLINARLKAYPQCRVLYLNSIQEATIAAPHHKIVADITNDYSIDVTLRLQTKPGLAIFESTVRMSTYAKNLTGTISRINLYGSQSYCINNYALKMFCYCHR